MINIIAAMSPDGVIGVNGYLPWQLPADLRRFKELTLNNVVIMGRKTYESINPPLRGRTIVVITRQKNYKVINGFAHDNLERMIERFKDDNLFIAGGGEIYEQTLHLADKLYLTIVNKNLEIKKNDEIVYFPEYTPEDWDLVVRSSDGDADYLVWRRAGLEEEKISILKEKIDYPIKEESKLL